MGILENFLKNNKFYLELDNDKDTYKWPTKALEKTESKEKTKAKQAGADQAKSDKVELGDANGDQSNLKAGESLPETAQATTQAVDTSYREEPAWIKSLYVAKEEVVETMVVEKTFAAESTIAKPRPNRRPGGSINKFRDLARELK